MPKNLTIELSALRMVSRELFPFLTGAKGLPDDLVSSDAMFEIGQSLKLRRFHLVLTLFLGAFVHFDRTRSKIRPKPS